MDFLLHQNSLYRYMLDYTRNW